MKILSYLPADNFIKIARAFGRMQYEYFKNITSTYYIQIVRKHRTIFYLYFVEQNYEDISVLRIITIQNGQLFQVLDSSTGFFGLPLKIFVSLWGNFGRL